MEKFSNDRRRNLEEKKYVSTSEQRVEKILRKNGRILVRGEAKLLKRDRKQ